MKLKLNCDMGESFGAWQMGQDEALMPLVDMANLACGFHASDPLTIQQSLALVKKYDLEVGAHPGYADLVGFGRRSMKCTSSEIEALVLYQCAAMIGMAQVQGLKVTYVKPHGALYNDMMQDEAQFEAIVKALASLDKNLKLMMLSSSKNSAYEAIAKKYEIALLYEVFADRAYTKEGFLVPRTQKGAVLHDEKEVIARIQSLKEKGVMQAITGEELHLKADTICVHGDTPEALAFIKSLRAYL